VDSDSVQVKFMVNPEHGEVSAILDRSDSSVALMVLGHGSGSTMHVPFISGLGAALVDRGIATFRYQYPYSESEDFIPYTDMDMDEPEVMVATVRAAIAAAASQAADLPLFAGGHSVSARLTSETDSESSMEDLQGIILLAFPLKGEMSRAAHFASSTTPLLFVQGSNDPYADIDEMVLVVRGIAVESELRVIDNAEQIVEIISDWVATRVETVG